MRKNIESFLADVSKNSSIIYKKKHGNNLFTIPKSEALICKSNCIYFCWWYRQNSDNSRVENIISKSYFVIDLDVIKHLKSIWKVDTDIDWLGKFEKINNTVEIFLKYLQNDFLKQWKYTVFSGNWLHIYYILNKEFKGNPSEYKLKVKALNELFFKEVQRIFNKLKAEHLIEAYRPDSSLETINQLIRLPNSYNCKDGNKIECKIIKEQDYNISIDDIEVDYLKNTDNRERHGLGYTTSQASPILKIPTIFQEADTNLSNTDIVNKYVSIAKVLHKIGLRCTIDEKDVSKFSIRDKDWKTHWMFGRFNLLIHQNTEKYNHLFNFKNPNNNYIWTFDLISGIIGTKKYKDVNNWIRNHLPNEYRIIASWTNARLGTTSSQNVNWLWDSSIITNNQEIKNTGINSSIQETWISSATIIPEKSNNPLETKIIEKKNQVNKGSCNIVIPWNIHDKTLIKTKVELSNLKDQISLGKKIWKRYREILKKKGYNLYQPSSAELENKYKWIKKETTIDNVIEVTVKVFDDIVEGKTKPTQADISVLNIINLIKNKIEEIAISPSDTNADCSSWGAIEV